MVTEFYGDNNFPAAKMLEDVSVVLFGERGTDRSGASYSTEVVLYIEYNYVVKDISISIYDMGQGDVIYSKSFTNPTQGQVFLRGIAKEYPDRIDLNEIFSTWDLFFKAAEKMVFISSTITNPDIYCETCNDIMRDEFEFLYVPAVPGSALDEASLYLHWEYGCLGGETLSGEYSEVADSMIANLSEMFRACEDEYKNDILKALGVLMEHELTNALEQV